MGLTPTAGRLVGEYSGGMVRRLESPSPRCTARVCSSSMSRPSGWTRSHATLCGNTSSISRPTTAQRCSSHPLPGEAESHCDRDGDHAPGEGRALDMQELSLSRRRGPFTETMSLYTYAGTALDSGARSTACPPNALRPAPR